MREPFNDMTGPEILGEVFARLRILSDGELGKADELLRIAKEMMPHARVNDSSFGICNIAGTMQKAQLLSQPIWIVSHPAWSTSRTVGNADGNASASSRAVASRISTIGPCSAA